MNCGSSTLVEQSAVVYRSGQLVARHTRGTGAEALAADGGVISVQVLNEFASVGLRKLAMPLGEVREVLSTIRALCEVMPIDIETHDLARTSMALHSDTISTRPPIRALPGERGPD